ncbi:ATP-binding protein [Saccharothrix coeruleofusca]|uniref:HTH cro/C1-type domain-containing protein n=1 Tax=Saccharothrix coeruleofusca TaxID=33919 RepID=A0A918ALB7_9PSEU|nr:tetratricopeptide repeat protein [Saccharothrix coeruleofusca]GGP44434.1 hypothetical protein GCM10010185_15190 [Saccharothrix coeruleofusca]
MADAPRREGRVSPTEVHTPADLARELELLRGRAARGSGKAKVSLADLAARVGVPRSTMHTYITGTTLAPADVLDRIVIALGASPAEQALWGEAWFRVAEHVHQSRKPAPTDRPVPRQLPAAPRPFTGRERELAALDEAHRAAPGADALVVAALGGAGGIGKTWLALHWAHRNLHRFPDGQLYVNLHGFDPSGTPVPPGVAVRGFLDALGVPAAVIPADLDAQVGLYRSLVAGRRMLVLLDNARDFAQVEPLLPGSATGTVLVTSRQKLPGLVSTYGARPVNVDVLTGQQARELLARHLGADRVAAEPAAVEAIIGTCAGLPLALGIVAARAATEPDLPLAVFARELARSLDALDLDGPATGLRATFSWSYRELPAEAARALRLLGACHCPELDVAAVAALTGAEPGEAARAMAVLSRMHFAHRTPDDRFHIHDLVRAYAADLAASTEPPRVLAAALERLVEHFLRRASAAMDAIAPYERLHRPEVPGPAAPPPDYDQALAWLDAERHNLVALAGRGRPEQTGRLSTTLHRYFVVGAHFTDAISVHSKALAVATDLAQRSNALRHLGAVHRWLGDYGRALEYNEQAAELGRELGDSRLEHAAVNNIGIIHERTGRHEQALDHYQQVLKYADDAEDHFAQGTVLHNMGSLYRRMELHEEALAHFRAALAVAREYDDHNLEGFTLADLGRLHLQLGQTAEALDYLDQALALAKKHNDRSLQTEVLNGLGELHHAQGELSSALAYHREALVLAENIGRSGERTRAEQGVRRCEQALGAETR